MASFDWKDWIVPGLAYAAAPFTGGATLPYAYSATVGAGAKTALSEGGGVGGGQPKGFDKNDPLLGPMGQLQTSSQSLRQTGQDFQGQGMEALGPALQYLKALAGENPSALMDATRGDRGRVIDQYDTARRSIANFGPRGGGTTSAIAEGRMAEGTQLADITSQAKRGAVSDLTSLGPQLAALGLSAEQMASADLNSIIQTILTKQGFDITKRGQNMQSVGELGTAIGSLAGLYLTREGGPWGPKPKTTGGP